MLALVQLEGLERRRPDQLSGGQRQRVALARSLALRPRMLLLDEPLAALDRKLRESTQAELLELQRKLGTTFIIVTHDQDEAMTVADRIGVMDKGRLVQVASPRELYESPNSRLGRDLRRRHQFHRRAGGVAEGQPPDAANRGSRHDHRHQHGASRSPA